MNDVGGYENRTLKSKTEREKRAVASGSNTPTCSDAQSEYELNFKFKKFDVSHDILLNSSNMARMFTFPLTAVTPDQTAPMMWDKIRKSMCKLTEFHSSLRITTGKESNHVELYACIRTQC